jgi:hypothetical protein
MPTACSPWFAPPEIAAVRQGSAEIGLPTPSELTVGCRVGHEAHGRQRSAKPIVRQHDVARHVVH